ncbi:MAG: hypothetical protein C0404_04075 [Verrucomicrobia bacterium]|nr:hypothetical protein [Verrucomicrobiota bacterium]
MIPADTKLIDKRRLLGEISGIVGNALDKLPGEYRLSLWLTCGCGLNCEDAADALACSGDVFQGLRTEGMCRLLGALEKIGIFTDELSVRAMIGTIMILPSPSSLRNRITDLVALSPGRLRVSFPESVAPRSSFVRPCGERSAGRRWSREIFD